MWKWDRRKTSEVAVQIWGRRTKAGNLGGNQNGTLKKWDFHQLAKANFPGKCKVPKFGMALINQTGTNLFPVPRHPLCLFVLVFGLRGRRGRVVAVVAVSGGLVPEGGDSGEGLFLTEHLFVNCVKGFVVEVMLLLLLMLLHIVVVALLYCYTSSVVVFVAVVAVGHCICHCRCCCCVSVPVVTLSQPPPPPLLSTGPSLIPPHLDLAMITTYPELFSRCLSRSCLCCCRSSCCFPHRSCRCCSAPEGGV